MHFRDSMQMAAEQKAPGRLDVNSKKRKGKNMKVKGSWLIAAGFILVGCTIEQNVALPPSGTGGGSPSAPGEIAQMIKANNDKTINAIQDINRRLIALETGKSSGGGSGFPLPPKASGDGENKKKGEK